MKGKLRRLIFKVKNRFKKFASKRYFLPFKHVDPYDAWLSVNKWNRHASEYLKKRLLVMDENALPKISIVMPVYNPPLVFFKQSIESVKKQVYSNWEICIADDCSTKAEIQNYLKEISEDDARIKIIFRKENGNISAATNSAASLATGEFLLFLDHDDELTADALSEVAIYLVQHPETDFLYSDDDKIDVHGDRYSPQFKPDWSPELLLSFMYFGHLCVVRRSIFEKIGGMRVGYEGSQDHDFALRATEISRQVGHLPLILYHWRSVPGSIAVSAQEKPESFSAGLKAVQDALNRRGVNGEMYRPGWAIQSKLGIYAPKFPDTGPSVTIVIPTRNHWQLIDTCLKSIEKTRYKNYQILIVDNGSDDPRSISYFQATQKRKMGENFVQVLSLERKGQSFNFSAINNQAAQKTKTDFILFLNNDIEIQTDNWLSQMIGYAQFKGVGAVGAKLVFPNGMIQHAGVIHGLHNGLAGHAFKLMPSDQKGYMSLAAVGRNCFAVTAACMLTPRQLFLGMGGFDEKNFAVAYNDPDYCYRLSQKNYRSVYCPDAVLIHLEGASRSVLDNPREVASYRQRFTQVADAYFSPHLSLENELFEIQPRRYFISNKALYPKLKILLCTNVLDFTGSALHQYEIALQLISENQIQPIVVSFMDGPLRLKYKDIGIETIIIDHPSKHSRSPNVYHNYLNHLSKTMEPHQINVIYANTLESFVMVDLGQQMGIPSIWNIHESQDWRTCFSQFGKKTAKRALKCFRYPYRIVFVSNATKNMFLSLNHHHNFTVIHNGIDVNSIAKAKKKWPVSLSRSELNIKKDEIVLLLLGTVCERKAQHELLEALFLIPPEWMDRLKCFIVGDRSSLYSKQLAALKNTLPQKLRSRVEIVPETPETGKYYQAADIFVCTSRIESFPRVILEAMAFDLPIVSTPVFGIREQIVPDVNGLFYTVGKPKELADALMQLLDNEAFRTHLANNAKYVLKSLNTFQEMVDVYSQIFYEAYFSQTDEYLQ